MKFLHLILLTLIITLTGCASQQPPPPTNKTLSKNHPALRIFQRNATTPTRSAPVAGGDLWARIRNSYSIPDVQNEYTTDREQWYSSRPDYVQRMIDRSRRYLFYVVEELEHRNMPVDLALLPFVESAFNPQATSSASAAGMWQFVPSTGREYALKQNIFRDERRDVLASTRAALDYLQNLYGQFGDWQLALAAYNWGPGNVRKAVAKSLSVGLGGTYETLTMPNETRYYLPKLQAVKNILADPGRFNLNVPSIPNAPYFQVVTINRDIDISIAARLAQLNETEFKALNPSALQPIILASGTPQLLLPSSNAAAFQRNIRSYRGPLASWTALIIPNDQTTSELAQSLGLSEEELTGLNGIPMGMTVTSGSTVIVPRRPHITTDVDRFIADNASLNFAPDRSGYSRYLRTYPSGWN